MNQRIEPIEIQELIPYVKNEAFRTSMLRKVLGILKDPNAPQEFTEEDVQYPLQRLQELHKQGKISKAILEEATQPLLPWIIHESMKSWEQDEITRQNVRNIYLSLRCYHSYHTSVLDVMGCKSPTDPVCVQGFLDTIFDAGEKCLEYAQQNEYCLDYLKRALTMINTQYSGSHIFLKQERTDLDDKSILDVLVPNYYSPISRERRVVAFYKATDKYYRKTIERRTQRILEDNQDSQEIKE